MGSRNRLMLERVEKGLVPPPFSISTIQNQTLPIDESEKTQVLFPSPPQNISQKSNPNETISNIAGKSYTDLINVLPENQYMKTPTNTEQMEKRDSVSTECDKFLKMVCTNKENTDLSKIQTVQEHPPHKGISEEVGSMKEAADEEAFSPSLLANDTVDIVLLDAEPSQLRCHAFVEEPPVSLKLSIPINGALLEKLDSSKDKHSIKSAPRDVHKLLKTRDQETDLSDFDGDDDSCDEYKPEGNKKRKRLISSSSNSSTTSSASTSSSESSSSSSSSSSSNVSKTSNNSSPKKGKKRKRNIESWKSNESKALKNAGKKYISKGGKTVEAKTMKPSCTSKCRLSCSTKFTNEERKYIFDTFWELASLQRQRDFLSACTLVLDIKCRRIKATATRPRNPNCCFHFMKDGLSIKVCKTFLINTLGIGAQTLRTVIESKTSGIGITPIDKRGKHSSHCKVNPEIKQSVRDHIDSIPRIESHYLRANTSREFVDGGLSIAEMHRNYKLQRENKNKEAANYDFYANIFNTEYNISFFVPKKDQCDQCVAYKNAQGEAKNALEADYIDHQRQKDLSRKEKKKDIEKCKETESNTVVAIYDLQSVMPVPLGESSAFFYKSKINCYNFTISDLKSECTNCYFWHEGLANRGAIEIGSCVLHYIKQVAEAFADSDLIFFSDNCCGQQKNRFIFTMYYYAVTTLPIKTITHKFLVRGHTQNEGDTVHSIIEKAIKKAKKSGPIYVPDQYGQIIRLAKKTGKPFKVHELNYEDFTDLKKMADDIGLNFNKDVNEDPVKVSEIKMIRFTKDSDHYEVKYAFEREWIQVPVKIKSRSSRKERSLANIEDVILKPAYTSKICITGKKKDDILHLLQNNIAPRHYEYFYNSIF